MALSSILQSRNSCSIAESSHAHLGRGLNTRTSQLFFNNGKTVARYTFPHFFARILTIPAQVRSRSGYQVRSRPSDLMFKTLKPEYQLQYIHEGSISNSQCLIIVMKPVKFVCRIFNIRAKGYVYFVNSLTY